MELTEICTLMERNRICRYVWVQQFQNFRTIKQFELSETAYLKVGALLNNILTIVIISYYCSVRMNMMLMLSGR